MEMYLNGACAFLHNWTNVINEILQVRSHKLLLIICLVDIFLFISTEYIQQVQLTKFETSCEIQIR